MTPTITSSVEVLRMRAILRKKALRSLVAGTMLVGGVGLVAGGVLPVPLDVMTTSHEGNSLEGHGPSADVPRGGADTDVEEEGLDSQNDDGPDENASATAKAVHEAQRLAGELGEDAPPCAHGKYVSAAATGAWDPVEDPDGAPAVEGMPCANGGGEAQESAETENEEVGPPAHARGKGDVDGDGSPGRSGAGGSDDD